MHKTFLETPDDLDWLFEVHLKDVSTITRERAVCAILHGNEDSPVKVEVFDRNYFQAEPIYVWPARSPDAPTRLQATP